MASGVRSVSISRDMSGSSREVIKIPGAKSDFSWRSRSFASSQSASHPPSQEELKLHRSVLTIEDWWIRMKNRRVFRVLKEAICAAEHSLTQEVLRKVSPMEAELLKDPAIKAKVKFRFGGDTFPPFILFKVFTSTSSVRGMAGGGVKYISGRRLIKPASEAAEDSRRQMGNRKFYDQILLDACHHQQLKVTDEVDVTTMKEYMQYAANMDESPAYLGGKENAWRKMNLGALPRYSPLHNLLELLERNQLGSTIAGASSHKRTTTTNALSLEKRHSFTRPPTQYEQIERIKTVSSLRSLSTPPHRAHPALRQESNRDTALRRSRQAQQRVEKMRKAYGLVGQTTPSPQATTTAVGERDTGLSEDGGRTSEMKEGESKRVESGDEEVLLSEPNEEMNEIERDAFELYQWSQELSFEDVG